VVVAKHSAPVNVERVGHIESHWHGRTERRDGTTRLASVRKRDTVSCQFLTRFRGFLWHPDARPRCERAQSLANALRKSVPLASAVLRCRRVIHIRSNSALSNFKLSFPARFASRLRPLVRDSYAYNAIRRILRRNAFRTCIRRTVCYLAIGGFHVRDDSI